MAGRRSELAALTAAAQHVAEGRGSTVILVGEPGIGKSYLLASFAAAASELGIVVCSGSAYELEQRRPFGVLLDAFGVRPGVEDGRRARVAARLHDHVAGGDLTVTGYWIGEELLAVIDEVCTQRPVALVVDDLQWVDSGSLALLARIARMASHQRILVVLSVRPAHRPAQVTQLVTGIVAAGGQPLAVGPLSDDEVAELTAEQVGAPPGDSLWNLLRRTGGSPLFVRELIAGLRAADALRIDRDHVETDETRIPNSVSVAVRHHLTQLDPDTIEVLRLAAVLCGPFTLAQLGHITGRSSVELYPCLRAALEAGILGDDGSRLRFTHEVIRATLYGDIPQAVRVGLHRDIARALTTAGSPALEVAEHYLRGATAGDRDAVHGLRQAAVAIAGQSPAEAADLVERAAALLPVTDAEQALLTLERARYLTSAGRAGEAESLCRELLRSTNDLDTERSIRMILADVLVAQSRLAEGLNETQRIVELTAAGTADHSRATANLSWALLSCSKLDDAQQMARKTIEQADVVNPPGAYTAFMTLAAACRYTRRHGEGLEHLDRAAAVAAQTTRRETESNPFQLWRALQLIDLDRLDEALQSARRGRATAQEAGVSFALVRYHFAIGTALHARGDVDDAVAEYAAGMDLADELGTGWRMSAYGALISIAVHGDDLATAVRLVAEGEDYLHRTDDRPQLPLFLRAKAELLEAQGRPADALALLAGVWRPFLAAGELHAVRFFAPDLVRLAVAHGDTELATSMAAAARSAAQQLPTSTGEAAALRCHGFIHRDLGAFLAAADAVVDNPRPLVRAAAHEDAGRAFADAGRVDDARRHLAIATDTYGQLGAVRDIDRVDSTARAAGIRRGQRGQRRRPTHGWDSLTPTERRVATLIASGLSNPVIAERMYLSRHTVQTHVSHILTKTGLSSRVEVAAVIAGQGGRIEPPPTRQLPIRSGRDRSRTRTGPRSNSPASGGIESAATVDLASDTGS